MRRMLPLLVTLVLLLTGCSGLPYPREMGDMALLRTMGVDLGEEGLSVTVSTGPRAKGLQGEGESALVLSAQGDSLSDAALTLQSLSDSYVFFGYVDQLLLGEELAGAGVTQVLDYFARDVELGLGAQLWVVRDASAQQAVEAGGDQGVEGRLSTLRLDGEMGIAALARTAGEVYTDLLEQGSAYLPALRPGTEEQAVLLEAGYAVLKGDTLVGFLEGEAARGLELLVGKPSSDIIPVELEGETVYVRITGGDTTCRLETEGGQVTGITVACRVTAQLAEYRTQPNRNQLQAVEEELTRVETERMTRALTQLRAWGADCAGLGVRSALSAPEAWRQIEEDWAEWFARLEPNLEVQVDIQD